MSNCNSIGQATRLESASESDIGEGDQSSFINIIDLRLSEGRGISICCYLMRHVP